MLLGFSPECDNDEPPVPPCGCGGRGRGGLLSIDPDFFSLSKRTKRSAPPRLPRYMYYKGARDANENYTPEPGSPTRRETREGIWSREVVGNPSRVMGYDEIRHIGQQPLPSAIHGGALAGTVRRMERADGTLKTSGMGSVFSVPSARSEH